MDNDKKEDNITVEDLNINENEDLSMEEEEVKKMDPNLLNNIKSKYILKMIFDSFGKKK